MELEDEPNVSQAKINDLIKEAVTKETAQLRKKLAKLESEAKSHPKGSRGRRQGASEKEKQGKVKTRKPTPKKVRFDGDNDKADGSDSDSKRSNSILRKPKYSGSQKSKQSNKNNKSNRRNNGQRRK